MAEQPKRSAVLDINTIYAALEAFIIPFVDSPEKFKEAVNNFEFFDSLQKKVLRTGALNDSPNSDGSCREEIDFDEFDKDVPMAWFCLITKAIFGLYLLSKISNDVQVSYKELQSNNGDKFRVNEAVIPCPRLGYVEYRIMSKADAPTNKLLKIGGIFINDTVAIKAPYDMEEYIKTMIEIDKANGVA